MGCAVCVTVHASGSTTPIGSAQVGQRKAAGLVLGGSPKSARVDLGYGGEAEDASGVVAGAGAGFVAEVAGAAEAAGTSMSLMMTTPAHAPALPRPATSAKQRRENEAKVKAAYEARGGMTVSYQSWKRGLHPMQVEAIVSGLPWETIQPACVAQQ